MAIPMLKIRRPLGRLIFNMGIVTPGKTVFLIEMAPRDLFYKRFMSLNLNLAKKFCLHINRIRDNQVFGSWMNHLPPVLWFNVKLMDLNDS